MIKMSPLSISSTDGNTMGPGLCDFGDPLVAVALTQHSLDCTLLAACDTGEMKTVQYLLERGCNPWCTPYASDTSANVNSDADAHGNDNGITDLSLMTPLGQAVYSGHMHIVTAILKAYPRALRHDSERDLEGNELPTDSIGVVHTGSIGLAHAAMLGALSCQSLEQAHLHAHSHTPANARAHVHAQTQRSHPAHAGTQTAFDDDGEERSNGLFSELTLSLTLNLSQTYEMGGSGIGAEASGGSILNGLNGLIGLNRIDGPVDNLSTSASQMAATNSSAMSSATAHSKSRSLALSEHYGLGVGRAKHRRHGIITRLAQLVCELGDASGLEDTGDGGNSDAADIRGGRCCRKRGRNGGERAWLHTLDVPDGSGVVPLQLAAQLGDHDSVRALIIAGADPTAYRSYDRREALAAKQALPGLTQKLAKAKVALREAVEAAGLGGSGQIGSELGLAGSEEVNAAEAEAEVEVEVELEVAVEEEAKAADGAGSGGGHAILGLGPLNKAATDARAARDNILSKPNARLGLRLICKGGGPAADEHHDHCSHAAIALLAVLDEGAGGSDGSAASSGSDTGGGTLTDGGLLVTVKTDSGPNLVVTTTTASDPPVDVECQKLSLASSEWERFCTFLKDPKKDVCAWLGLDRRRKLSQRTLAILDAVTTTATHPTASTKPLSAGWRLLDMWCADLSYENKLIRAAEGVALTIERSHPELKPNPDLLVPIIECHGNLSTLETQVAECQQSVRAPPYHIGLIRMALGGPYQDAVVTGSAGAGGKLRNLKGASATIAAKGGAGANAAEVAPRGDVRGPSQATAEAHRRSETALALIEGGADTAILDETGAPPALLAARLGYWKVAERLLIPGQAFYAPSPHDDVGGVDGGAKNGEGGAVYGGDAVAPPIVAGLLPYATAAGEYSLVRRLRWTDPVGLAAAVVQAWVRNDTIATTALLVNPTVVATVNLPLRSECDGDAEEEGGGDVPSAVFPGVMVVQRGGADVQGDGQDSDVDGGCARSRAWQSALDATINPSASGLRDVEDVRGKLAEYRHSAMEEVQRIIESKSAFPSDIEQRLCAVRGAPPAIYTLFTATTATADGERRMFLSCPVVARSHPHRGLVMRATDGSLVFDNPLELDNDLADELGLAVGRSASSKPRSIVGLGSKLGLGLALAGATSAIPLWALVASLRMETAAGTTGEGAWTGAGVGGGLLHTGYTLVHEAAKHGDVDMLRRLLHQGASPSTIDVLSRTPKDLAHAGGHVRAEALLQAYHHAATTVNVTSQPGAANDESLRLEAHGGGGGSGGGARCVHPAGNERLVDSLDANNISMVSINNTTKIDLALDFKEGMASKGPVDGAGADDGNERPFPKPPTAEEVSAMQKAREEVGEDEDASSYDYGRGYIEGGADAVSTKGQDTADANTNTHSNSDIDVNAVEGLSTTLPADLRTGPTTPLEGPLKEPLVWVLAAARTASLDVVGSRTLAIRPDVSLTFLPAVARRAAKANDRYHRFRSSPTGALLIDLRRQMALATSHARDAVRRVHYGPGVGRQGDGQPTGAKENTDTDNGPVGRGQGAGLGNRHGRHWTKEKLSQTEQDAVATEVLDCLASGRACKRALSLMVKTAAIKGGDLSKVLRLADGAALELSGVAAGSQASRRGRNVMEAGKAPSAREGAKESEWAESLGRCFPLALLHALKPLLAPQRHTKGTSSVVESLEAFHLPGCDPRLVPHPHITPAYACCAALSRLVPDWLLHESRCSSAADGSTLHGAGRGDRFKDAARLWQAHPEIVKAVYGDVRTVLHFLRKLCHIRLAVLSLGDSTPAPEPNSNPALPSSVIPQLPLIHRSTGLDIITERDLELDGALDLDPSESSLCQLPLHVLWRHLQDTAETTGREARLLECLGSLEPGLQRRCARCLRAFLSRSREPRRDRAGGAV